MTGGAPAAPTRSAARELPFTSAHTSSAKPSASVRQRRAGAASKPEGPGASRRAVRKVSEASISIGDPGTGQVRAGTPENGGPRAGRQPLSSELTSSPAGAIGGRHAVFKGNRAGGGGVGGERGGVRGGRGRHDESTAASASAAAARSRHRHGHTERRRAIRRNRHHAAQSAPGGGHPVGEPALGAGRPVGDHPRGRQREPGDRTSEEH